MLHLARKAFFPAPIPFPLLHVDTTWKFREMIAHRDAIADLYGVRLIVHTNLDGAARLGIAGILHTDAESTRSQLESTFGLLPMQ